MGKILMALSLLIPVAINLMYDSRGGMVPKIVKHQRILVTGVSEGLGEQLAYQYAKLGARLVITAMKEDAITNVSRTCMTLGAQEVHFVTADIADPKGQFKVIEFAEKHLGGLDQLILNHAVHAGEWWTGSPENMSSMNQVFRANFFSNVGLASKALPLLTASQGRIGLVLSGSGELGTVSSSVYTASQFALRGFFSSLRQELRHKGTGVSVTFGVTGSAAFGSSSMAPKENLPTDSLVTTQDAASAILESVALRHYNLRFDWKLRALLFINDLFPEFSESNFQHVELHDNSTWFPRMIQPITPATTCSALDEKPSVVIIDRVTEPIDST